MAKTSRRMPVAVDAVWAVLEDGRSYADWVVGTQAITAVDDGFPAVGRRLHYRVGVGPLGWDGETSVLEVDPGVRLRLEAKAWPLGTAVITLSLVGSGAASTVTIDERPAGGIGRVLHTPLSDLAIDVRNREQLRRLEKLALGKKAAF